MTDRAIELVGADGSTWDLTTGPLYASPDQPLFGLPAVAVSSRPSILAPGATITGVQHSSRDLVVPLMLNATTATIADDTLRAFARAIDPLRGDVTVIVTDADGDSREIEGTYRGGFESIEYAWCRAETTGGRILLLCANPYWRNTIDDTEVFDPTFVGTDTTFDSGTVDFDDAWPFDGEGDGLFIFPLDNLGDVNAWPVFTIVGPASITSATCLSTGESWELADLLDGETLIIDTDPRQAQATVNGLNAYGRLGANPSLWTLPPGAQNVALQLDGGDAGSSFEMRWRPQYLTA